MQVQDAQSQHGPHSASALQAGGHAPCLTEASSAAMWRVLEEGEGAARVVVSAVAPFVMLGCNAAFVELLGQVANGSALKILHGQTTRFDALESVIVNASKGGAHVCQLRLYSAAGDARLVRVEAKLVQPQDGETARQSTEGGVKMMLLSLMPANHICRYATQYKHRRSLPNCSHTWYSAQTAQPIRQCQRCLFSLACTLTCVTLTDMVTTGRLT